jgi:predicted SprT family Zn-dependent metalloprotease
MHPAEAKNLATRLMREYGLHNWRFGFDHARRRFGACRMESRMITLSRPLVLLNGEAQVRDTILHEIAHALTPGDGHGAQWRRMCRRIGANPRRCYTEAEVTSPPRRAAPYVYGCGPCDWWVERRRVTRTKYVCRKCRGELEYRVRGVEPLNHPVIDSLVQ